MSARHQPRNAKRKLSDQDKKRESLLSAYVAEYESRLLANEDPPPNPATYMRRARGPQEAKRNLRIQLNLATLMIVGAREGLIDWDALTGKPGMPQKKRQKRGAATRTTAARAKIKKTAAQ